MSEHGTVRWQRWPTNNADERGTGWRDMGIIINRSHCHDDCFESNQMILVGWCIRTKWPSMLWWGCIWLCICYLHIQKQYRNIWPLRLDLGFLQYDNEHFIHKNSWFKLRKHSPLSVLGTNCVEPLLHHVRYDMEANVGSFHILCTDTKYTSFVSPADDLSYDPYIPIKRN